MQASLAPATASNIRPRRCCCHVTAAPAVESPDIVSELAHAYAKTQKPARHNVTYSAAVAVRTLNACMAARWTVLLRMHMCANTLHCAPCSVCASKCYTARSPAALLKMHCIAQALHCCGSVHACCQLQLCTETVTATKGCRLQTHLRVAQAVLNKLLVLNRLLVMLVIGRVQCKSVSHQGVASVGAHMHVYHGVTFNLHQSRHLVAGVSKVVYTGIRMWLCRR